MMAAAGRWLSVYDRLEVGLEGSLVHWVAANNMAVCPVSDASCDHLLKEVSPLERELVLPLWSPWCEDLALIQLLPARVSTQWPVLTPPTFLYLLGGVLWLSFLLRALMFVCLYPCRLVPFCLIQWIIIPVLIIYVDDYIVSQWEPFQTGSCFR